MIIVALILLEVFFSIKIVVLDCGGHVSVTAKGCGPCGDIYRIEIAGKDVMRLDGGVREGAGGVQNRSHLSI